MSIEKLADKLVDNAVATVHSLPIETAETALKAASDIPGHVGSLAGKVAEVIDDVQELVGDLGDIVKEVVDIIVPDKATPVIAPEPTDVLHNTPQE